MRSSLMKTAIRACFIYVLAAVGAFSITPAPARAQSLLDMLFGPSNPRPVDRGSAARLLPPGVMPPPGYRVPWPAHDRPGLPLDPLLNDGEQPAGQGETFKTVCVRLCDGYYWPISQSTPRSGFYNDANKCAASCSSEARMFYLPGNASIEAAVDQTGRPYPLLTHAFSYRKVLHESCSCKPAPWSESAIARHQRYAFDEKAAQDARPTPAADVASAQPIGPEPTGDSTQDVAASAGQPAVVAESNPRPATKTTQRKPPTAGRARPEPATTSRPARDRAVGPGPYHMAQGRPAATMRLPGINSLPRAYAAPAASQWF